MYHNVRDKNGRFKKGKGTKRKAAKKNAKLANTAKRKKATKGKKQFDTIISAFLLDDSSSMMGKEIGVVNGFNNLVTKGREDAKRTGINGVESVAFFSAPGSLKFIEEVKSLFFDGYGYRTGQKRGEQHCYNATGGNTALWQSTAELIAQVEGVQKKYPKSNVILTIFTDGEENASTGKWQNETEIKRLIEQKQKDGWVVTYIGAERTLAAAQATAKNMGIFASNATNFVNTSAGINKVVNKLATARGAYYSGASVGTATQDGFFQQTEDED